MFCSLSRTNVHHSTIRVCRWGGGPRVSHLLWACSEAPRWWCCWSPWTGCLGPSAHQEACRLGAGCRLKHTHRTLRGGSCCCGHMVAFNLEHTHTPLSPPDMVSDLTHPSLAEATVPGRSVTRDFSKLPREEAVVWTNVRR